MNSTAYALRRATTHNGANSNNQDNNSTRDTVEVPEAYRLNQVTLSDQSRVEQTTVGPPYGNSRPRKLLYIVSFKCARVDVFYLHDNTGLNIKEGDIVIVEADRGQDLGTVQHAEITPDEARNYKRRYGEEQYKWLMMFSKHNNQGSVNPNATVYEDGNRTGGRPMINNAIGAGMSRDNFNNLKPKAIKRLANNHEIKMLAEKEGNEAKAKRTCQQKVAGLGLQMEILDSEWQWDFQKLIFYYYADHYINFKDLITELYRIYKTRIWLSAINPASFSQHALGSPPSGIGPGALPNHDNVDPYATTGQDPDPYGAVPPYRIGYDTYTPNYPGIPGVVNSFANTPPSGFVSGSAGTNPFGHTAQPFNPMPTYDMSAGSYSTTPTTAPPATNTMYGTYGYGMPLHNTYEPGQFSNPYTTPFWPSDPIPINRPPPPPSSSEEEQRARRALNVGRPPGTPRYHGFGDDLLRASVPVGQQPFGRPLARAQPPTPDPTADRTTGRFGPDTYGGASEFVPHAERPTSWAQPFSTFGQAPPAFRGPPPAARFGGPFVPASENDGKDQLMLSYLDSLYSPSKEDSHADAMSRER